jgi:glycine cleavage system aminomethyltransferase T
VAEPYRVSAVHGAHLALGARLRDEAGWRVPDAYGAPAEEAARARAGVGLADASACGKLLVQAAAMEPVLVKAANVEWLAVGTALRIRIEAARTLACRLAEDEVLLLTPPAEAAAVASLLESLVAGAGCAHLTDVTSGLAVLDVLGPQTRALLARLSPLDLAALPPLAVVQGELAGVHAIVVALDRPAGVRALVAREYGAFVWEALVEAGRDLGLTPVGTAARALLEAE